MVLLNCGHALLCLELGRLATTTPCSARKVSYPSIDPTLRYISSKNLSVGDALARLVKNLDCYWYWYVYIYHTLQLGCVLSQLATLAACAVKACNRANGVTALRAQPHNKSINFTWDEPDYY